MRCCFDARVCALASLVIGMVQGAEAAFAQVVPDLTLGADEGSVVAPAVFDGVEGGPVNGLEIGGGAQRGINLFHSFAEFGVLAGEPVYFANPAGVANIFSRVTGDGISRVDDVLGVSGPASLFLLNPNGIIFGPGARLDIAGSFVVSTATAVEFSDGQVFSAAELGEAPLLKIGVTPGLQYGAVSGNITNQGDLKVGRDLTLGAQQLDVAGQLEAERDITLQGEERQLSDAAYTTGGYLFTQDLDGNIVDFLIPHEQVITANGDLQLQWDYDGPSVHILAGGKITGTPDWTPHVTVRAPGTGRITEQISDGVGGIQPITLQARNERTLDIRSGLDWEKLGGAKGNQTVPELGVIWGNESSEDAITGNEVKLNEIDNRGGNVNIAAGGDITVQGILTLQSQEDVNATRILGKDAGNVLLSAGGSISTGQISSWSDVRDFNSSLQVQDRVKSRNTTSARGGDIFLSAGGAIKTEGIFSESSSFSSSDLSSLAESGDAISGRGGHITVMAGGSIETQAISSYSSAASAADSNERSFSGKATSSDGGYISLFAGGNAIAGRINSSSSAFSFSNRKPSDSAQADDSLSGRGGHIFIDAAGSVNVGEVDSSASSNSTPELAKTIKTGKAITGDGGDIVIHAGESLTAEDINSRSIARASEQPRDASSADFAPDSFQSEEAISGRGGKISLKTERQDIHILGISSGTYTFSEAQDVRGSQGGAILIDAYRDLVYADIISSGSYTESNFGSVISDLGGNITLKAGRDISGPEQLQPGARRLIDASSSALVFDGVGNSQGGDSGAISLWAGRNINADDFFSYSYSYAHSGDVDGGVGGKIKLESGGMTNVENMLAASYSSSFSESGTGNIQGGRGGEININSKSDIEFRLLDSSSRSQSPSIFGKVAGGNGGRIYAISEYGNIVFKSIKDEDNSFGSLASASFSQAFSGLITGADGGNVQLLARNGAIQSFGIDEQQQVIKPTVNSISFAEKGESGDGGSITLEATMVSDLEFLSLSSSGQSGSVNITTSNGIELERTNISASKKLLIPARLVNPGSSPMIPSFSFPPSRNASPVDLNASPVTLNASPIVLTDSGSQEFIEISLREENRGSSGSIYVKGKGDFLFTNSIFLSGTNGGGDAGDIVVSTSGNVIFDNSSVDGETESTGRAGDLRINAGQSLILLGEGSDLSLQTSGRGHAGSIEINAPEIIIDQKAKISSSTTDSGQAGRIILNTETLTIKNGGQILAFSSGSGNSSTIKIDATKEVQLGEGVQDSVPIISVETSQSGKAGNIIINTPKFTLSETARVTATATKTATNPQGGGSITLSANEMDLAGTVGIFAETEGQSPGGTMTLQTYENNPDLKIDLATGATVSASTSGSGKGGSIFITAPSSIQISGKGEISAETSGPGIGGDIRFKTSELTIMGEAKISTTATLPKLSSSSERVEIIEIEQGGTIPESGTEGSATFNFLVPNLGEEAITDLDIRFSALHTYNGDLTASLVSPTGTVVNLFERIGDEGDNFQDTVFDDSATTSANESAAPFNTALRPLQALSSFDGENPEGTWRLEIEDTAQSDSGTLLRAGESAPWGTAIGTQLILKTPQNPPEPSKPTVDNPDLGRGGTITLEVEKLNLLDGQILAETEGFTKGGDVIVQVSPDTGSTKLAINLDNQSVMSAAATGAGKSGQGGSLILSAPEAIAINGNGTLSAETNGAGIGGDIQIITSKLSISDGTRLSTTAKLPEPKTVEIRETKSLPLAIINVDSSGVIPESGTSGEATFTFTVPDTKSELELGDSITDLDVRFSAAHTYNNDLRVSLESPTGTILELFNGVGSDSDNFQDILLDDSASESLVNTSAPFSGSFNLMQGAGQLSRFNGENAAGTWELVVEDQAEQDSGTLFKAGESAPWGTALGTQLLLETQSTQIRTETVDVAPRPTPENSDLGRGGTITVRANQVDLNNAKILAETEGFTKGGDIIFEANTDHNGRLAINLSNQPSISASTAKAGQGGALQLSAPESITITGNGKLSAETSGTGSAGQVQVQTPYFTLQNNAQLSTSTAAKGNGGTLSLNASESITLKDNAGLVAQSTNTGNAGNIQLTTANLSLTNQSQIATSTAGEGNAGNITLNPGPNDALNINIDKSRLTAATSSSGNGGDLEFKASEAINITGNGTLTAQTSSTGSAGNVRITTDHLTLDQGTTLSTTATATANPPANEDGSKANITLNANEMNLFGTVQVLSETQGNAKAGTLTLQSNGAEDLNINLRDNSKVSASTSGQGNGGELVVKADNTLTISGQGTLSAETSGKGQAGAINVEAQQFTLQDGATLSSSTTSSGAGGNISVTANDGITLRNRARLVAQSTETASGEAGDVTLRTSALTLDNANITVSSKGTGDGGNIDVGASRATFLRNNSVIETDAVNSGNGGNIQLKTPVLIGERGDNSDIIANAQLGNGGQIEITAENILNFEQQDGQIKTKLRNNATNDISASSEGGTDGIITLNTPDTDPASSLSELPADVTDGSRLIAQNLCRQGQGSEFIVTGRGGLPQGPQDTLQAPSDWEDWRFPEQLTDVVLNDNELNLGELRPKQTTPAIPSAQATATTTPQPTITEAQGWQKNATGAIQLITAPTQATAAAQATSPLACRQLKRQLPG